MESKPWYCSKTVWGVLLAAVGLVLSAFHMQVTFDDQAAASVADAVGKVAEGVGILVALYGRAVTKKPLRSGA